MFNNFVNSQYYPPNYYNTSAWFYENTIRLSNTVFSTMICPECGKRLIFERNDCSPSFHAYCPTENHYSKEISFDGMCDLLNNNGLNCLVTPYNIAKKEDEKSTETELTADDIPPPDGFKIEPSE